MLLITNNIVGVIDSEATQILLVIFSLVKSHKKMEYLIK